MCLQTCWKFLLRALGFFRATEKKKVSMKYVCDFAGCAEFETALKTD